MKFHTRVILSIGIGKNLLIFTQPYYVFDVPAIIDENACSSSKSIVHLCAHLHLDNTNISATKWVYKLASGIW